MKVTCPDNRTAHDSNKGLSVFNAARSASVDVFLEGYCTSAKNIMYPPPIVTGYILPKFNKWHCPVIQHNNNAKPLIWHKR